MKGKTGMLPLDDMLPKRGWTQEPADGFQTSDGEDTWRNFLHLSPANVTLLSKDHTIF